MFISRYRRGALTLSVLVSPIRREMAAFKRKSSVKWEVTWKYQQKNRCHKYGGCIYTVAVSWNIFETAAGELLENNVRRKREASFLLSLCVPAEGTQCVNIPLLSLLGRRTDLGRALGRRRSITEAFLRDGSKDRLSFGGLWQTAWGPLKALALRCGERIKPGSQRTLFIKCERRQTGFKINFHPLFLLLFTLGVSGYDGWTGWNPGLYIVVHITLNHTLYSAL